MTLDDAKHWLKKYAERYAPDAGIAEMIRTVLAALERQTVFATIGANDADVDLLLERFDQTAPELQRKIVVAFVVKAHAAEAERDALKEQVIELSEGYAMSGYADRIRHLAEERDAALAREVALREALLYLYESGPTSGNNESERAALVQAKAALAAPAPQLAMWSG